MNRAVSRRWYSVLLSAALLAALAAPAVAQSSKDRQCTGDPDVPADAQIAGCTEAIGSQAFSGKALAALYTNRGNAYLANRDLDGAFADYSQAIALDPKYVAAYVNRGNVEKAKGNVEAAIDDYTDAIALDPDYPYTYSSRGHIYLDKGDLNRALADDNKAIALDPKYTPAYVNRGVVYFRKHDADRALADFDEAIALEPGYAVGYVNRGIVHKMKGEFDLALADESKAIELDPKDALAYYNRGFSRQAKSDLDGAIADYDQAIELNPSYGDAFVARGLAKLYAGSAARARVDLNRASSLQPYDAHKALWLDIVNKRLDKPSVLALAQTYKSGWPDAVVRYYLGQVTFKDMLAAAENADVELKSEHVCEANVFGGELALGQGRKDEAMRLFRAAGAGCPKALIEWIVANAELKALGGAP
jgi:lipoprotein NlpI